MNELIQRFEYKPPTRMSLLAIQRVHELYSDVARELNQICPDGRELSIAILRLEESLSWAEKAVPRE